MEKNITIYDISKLAKVSPATVSRVLTGNANVSDKKRELVKKIIKEYDFHPNDAARSLSRKFSSLIGFIVPDIQHAYFSNIYFEFEKIASEFGYNVLLSNSFSDYKKESQLLKIFQQKNADGIVFMGGRIDDLNLKKEYIEELLKINKKIPIVLTSKAKKINLVQVYSRENESIEKMIICLKNNCVKTVGVLGGDKSTSVSVSRSCDIIKSCQKHSIEVRDEWVIDGGFNFESGIVAMKKMLLLNKLPDAICCINDYVAAGVIKVASSNNIKIPSELKIIGFDGTDISTIINPSLTTVQSDYYQFANMIYNCLTSLIKKEETNKINEIPMSLLVRESTNNSSL